MLNVGKGVHAVSLVGRGGRDGVGRTVGLGMGVGKSEGSNVSVGGNVDVPARVSTNRIGAEHAVQITPNAISAGMVRTTERVSCQSTMNSLTPVVVYERCGSALSATW